MIKEKNGKYPLGGVVGDSDWCRSIWVINAKIKRRLYQTYTDGCNVVWIWHIAVLFVACVKNHSHWNGVCHLEWRGADFDGDGGCICVWRKSGYVGHCWHWVDITWRGGA